MVSFAVLASGNGSNFQALLDGIRSKEVTGGEVRVLITDNPQAYVIKRAEDAGIPVRVVLRSDFKKREGMDIRIMEIADEYSVDYIYLLGYMRLVKAPEIFARYRNRMINLHPALLPSFPGVDAQMQAFQHGCKVSGITIHFVNEGLDAGPIIYQKAADISDCKDAHEVVDRLRLLEHEGVKKVAAMLQTGTFVIKEGRRTQYIYFPI